MIWKWKWWCFVRLPFYHLAVLRLFVSRCLLIVTRSQICSQDDNWQWKLNLLCQTMRKGTFYSAVLLHELVHIGREGTYRDNLMVEPMEWSIKGRVQWECGVKWPVRGVVMGNRWELNGTFPNVKMFQLISLSKYIIYPLFSPPALLVFIQFLPFK